MRCSALRHQVSDELRYTHPDHRSEDLLYVPEGRPCGRRPAAAVLSRQHHGDRVGVPFSPPGRAVQLREQASRRSGRNEEALSRRG
jgi:hypothetical protein